MEQLSPNSDELPHEAVIRAALKRVVASSHLNQSPQLASFLRFVVEETLAGRSDRIKAYSIAADALGRDSSFDADNDPIVRASAGRLRRALRHYYADGGCDDPVVIEIPFGNYVPVFGANSGPRRAKTRMQMWRRRAVGSVRKNLPQVALIAVIAIRVSLGFDFLWMAVGVMTWSPATQNVQQSTLPATLELTGSAKR